MVAIPGSPQDPKPASQGVTPPQTIVVQTSDSLGQRMVSRMLMLGLGISILANVVMYASYSQYFGDGTEPTEKFHSGDKDSSDKIARIEVTGTIMPPFSGRVIKALKKAKDDPKVKAILLCVDSPGGLVTDSHQIYHKLNELRTIAKKPIYVSMKSMAASGGYYVSMGAGPEGKIYAEETTWTGSIGVIIPHYEVTGLADKLGVKATPLTTGPFKDTLSPFKEMTEPERVLWKDIIDQSYQEFITVIDEGRGSLNREQVTALATGQIYTARDAKANGLIDEIGYEEDALAALQKSLGLTKARVVSYSFPADLISLLGVTAPDRKTQFDAWMEFATPRPMYMWGSVPPPFLFR